MPARTTPPPTRSATSSSSPASRSRTPRPARAGRCPEHRRDPQADVRIRPSRVLRATLNPYVRTHSTSRDVESSEETGDPWPATASAGTAARPTRRARRSAAAVSGAGAWKARGRPRPPPSARGTSRTASPTPRPSTPPPGVRAPRRGGAKGTSELVVGRNPVFEALRDGVPATTLYVQQFIDNDERVREALQLAAERGNINLMEAPRPELDRMTNGLNHQGLVLQVPPYDYAHPEDLAAAAFDNGDDPLIVALDGVTDPRNLGAVVRSVSRLRRPRRGRAGAPRGRDDGRCVEDLGGHGRPYAGRPCDEPDPRRWRRTRRPA